MVTFTPFSEKEFLQVICVRQERKAIAKERTQNRKNKNVIEKKKKKAGNNQRSWTEHALGSDPSVQGLRIFDA